MKKEIILLFSLCATVTSAVAKNPNVILIYTDDMGYGDLSILNNKSKFETPNMDALARSGVCFTDAHTVSSVSTPSRYGLMTGEYSWRSRLKAGVTWGFSSALIPADKPTIATMMQRQGYKTACVGKWHLGMEWATTDGKPAKSDGSNVDYSKPLSDTPTSRGFDYFYGISASLDIPPYVTIENDRVETLPTARYEVTTFNQKDDEVVENPFLRAGDYVKGEQPEDFLPKFTKKVKSLLSKYSREDDPFFIYFAANAPHAPLAPSKKFRGKSGIGRYGDFVLEVDDVVGQIVKHLKKCKIYDDTIIILSSDNGAERFAYYRYPDTNHSSSAQWKGVKRDLWEGGHRVPFVMSWGEKIAPKMVDETVCLSDVYATLADITGGKLPADEAQDSYSLLPLLDNQGEYEREYTIHHSSSGRFAIRKGDWVLIENGYGDDNRWLEKIEYYDALGYPKFSKERPKGELFNLKDDPQQFTSLYEKEPHRVAELTSILDRVTNGWNTRRDKYNKR
ncbi:MAG: arylsulfatase [Rikenellaceae bacterium]